MRLRAAEDRVAVAEGMALDMRKQCDAAAVTISRLIDENRWGGGGAGGERVAEGVRRGDRAMDASEAGKPWVGRKVEWLSQVLGHSQGGSKVGYVRKSEGAVRGLVEGRQQILFAGG